MTTCKFHRETALRIGTIFLLICIVARIVQISLYSYATFYQMVQSDMAGDLLQAELAASQGHLLFADNWFISTELRVIGINIIPTILFYFGLSYRLIWALTCGISTIFITSSVYLAMRMLRIERFECVDSNIQPIGNDLIDMKLMGRLHPYDMSRIEQGILLHDMLEGLRYGNITQAEYDEVFAKDKPAKDTDKAPQPKGESGEAVAELAANPRAPRPAVTRLDQ